MCGLVDNTATVSADNHDDVWDDASVTVNCAGLIITKSVDWNGAVPSLLQTFTICIKGPSYPNGNETQPAPGACQTVGSAGGDLIWNNLIPGDYLVTETPPGGAWTVTGSGVQVTVEGDCDAINPATIAPDQCTATHTVTNKYKHGEITVTKVVNWNGMPVEPGKTFQICIQGPSFPTGTEPGACLDFTYNALGDTRTWMDLIPGDYTVTEAPPGFEWTVVGGEVTVNVPAGCQSVSPAAVDPGEPGVCPSVTVINTHKRGSLKVTKVVKWNGVPATDQSFEICITGPSFPAPTQQNGGCRTLLVPAGAKGSAVTWLDLLPGDYTVTETTPSPQGAWMVAIEPTMPVTVVVGETAEATVTNSRKAPKLLLDKAVVGDGSAFNGLLTFTIRITNTGPIALAVVPLKDVYTASVPVQFVSSQPPHSSVSGNVVTWNNLVPQFGGSPLQPGQSYLVSVTFRLTPTEEALQTFDMDNSAIVEGAKDVYDTPANRSDDTERLRGGFTAVTLLYFTATPASGGVRLDWATQDETDNYGFYLLRSTTGRLADAVRLPAFIPGTGRGTHGGAVYSHIDADVQPGYIYTYWLVDVDLDGTETIHPETASVSITGMTNRVFLPVVGRSQ
jgi:hypothetical protein